jgi:hypothetical protein
LILQKWETRNPSQLADVCASLTTATPEKLQVTIPLFGFYFHSHFFILIFFSCKLVLQQTVVNERLTLVSNLLKNEIEVLKLVKQKQEKYENSFPSLSDFDAFLFFFLWGTT